MPAYRVELVVLAYNTSRADHELQSPSSLTRCFFPDQIYDTSWPLKGGTHTEPTSAPWAERLDAHIYLHTKLTTHIETCSKSCTADAIAN